MSGSAVSNHVDGVYCPVPGTQVALSKWPVPGEEPLVGRKGGMRRDSGGLTTSQGCLGGEQVDKTLAICGPGHRGQGRH